MTREWKARLGKKELALKKKTIQIPKNKTEDRGNPKEEKQFCQV